MHWFEVVGVDFKFSVIVKISFECSQGHITVTKLSHIEGSIPRAPSDCRQCVVPTKTELKTKQDVDRMWRTSTKFYFDGYKFISATRKKNWFYKYQCKKGHIKEAVFGTTRTHRCSDSDSTCSLPEAEIRKRILDHWQANPQIYKGYQLLECAKWLEKSTKIKYPLGHISSTIAKQIVDGMHRQRCVARRIFNAGRKHKSFKINNKTFNFQGYKNRMLTLLCKKVYACSTYRKKSI